MLWPLFNRPGPKGDLTTKDPDWAREGFVLYARALRGHVTDWRCRADPDRFIRYGPTVGPILLRSRNVGDPLAMLGDLLLYGVITVTPPLGVTVPRDRRPSCASLAHPLEVLSLCFRTRRVVSYLFFHCCRNCRSCCVRFIVALFVVIGVPLGVALDPPWGTRSLFGSAAAISPRCVIVRYRDNHTKVGPVIPA